MDVLNLTHNGNKNFMHLVVLENKVVFLIVANLPLYTLYLDPAGGLCPILNDYAIDVASCHRKLQFSFFLCFNWASPSTSCATSSGLRWRSKQLWNYGKSFFKFSENLHSSLKKCHKSWWLFRALIIS